MLFAYGVIIVCCYPVGNRVIKVVGLQIMFHLPCIDSTHPPKGKKKRESNEGERERGEHQR